MILDVGSQASVIVAADKKLDLTDRVLARLKTMPAPNITGSHRNQRSCSASS